VSFLEEVRAKRKKLADVLSDDEYSGIREIVEELYPDRAHFIYELLQNAEDAGATVGSFELSPDGVAFVHDGRPFTQDDVWGITNIGKGTKKEQDDAIGRFGVGFKAVFAYCETPHIWSPTFSFKITDLVLPSALDPRPELGNRTRFEFPFNNPKKKTEDAYAEVKAGLSELAETTLLFLSHLQSIRWEIDRSASGEVRRIQHSTNHVEVLKQSGDHTTVSSHFVKFDQPVDGLAKQRLAVAFALDFLPNVTGFDATEPLAKQMKVIAATRGQVAVFFPAEKETSGFRFHLHAPFVPELSRASIKDTPVNQPLFQQLGTLTAASLHQIRDLELLTPEFLNVLPTPQDQIPPRYQVVRAAIVDEMNTKPLTPTYAKSHAPAKHLLQGKASLKDLLSEEDIEFLVDHDQEPPHWAVGIAQKNSNADRFLNGLAITEWDIEQLVQRLVEGASEGIPPHTGPWDNERFMAWFATKPKFMAKFMAWLATKPMNWHQKLYSLLYVELSPNDACGRLEDVRIARLRNGNYGIGDTCFFPSDGEEHDELLPRVDAGVYTCGKNKAQQDHARKFLEAIGVREVGEGEQVEVLLKQRYTKANLKPQKQDLKRFVALVEKDSTKASLFADYFVFEGKDGNWRKPNGVFLDQPISDTGLTAYHDAFGEHAKRVALAESYAHCGVSGKRLVRFAEAVGVQTRLEIKEVLCNSNPQYAYLQAVGGERRTSPIDRDYTIVELDRLLTKQSIEIAKLVWRTMCSLPRQPDCLQAAYQRNKSRGSRQSDSQLVHQLRRAAWIPQGTGGLFVRPKDAQRDMLPDGFPFDPGLAWLKAIGFGEETSKKSEEQRQREVVAKELGFADKASLERAKRFAALPPEEQERILADRERCPSAELPDHEPANPERRAERVATKAADAPERRTEERMRSVSVGRDEVKQEAAQYLRQQYTNADGEMICQVCKAPLPFKLDDGSDYFEKVELLPELKKRHYQNYLALCPNHAAMFQHANASADSMQDMFVDLAGNELKVVLAQKETTIYFTRTHIADLRDVIRVDRAEPDTP